MVQWMLKRSSAPTFGGGILPTTTVDDNMKNPFSKLAENPQQRKWAIAIVAALIVLVFFLLPASTRSAGDVGGAVSPGGWRVAKQPTTSERLTAW
jgi:hypothetical protein